ncbi:sensor histidine kinase [Undibacterium fentianense]|uniref:histidine kinase n=1 Tax=Undibacterium fentianense TaxID=2828728 RepID=A0A941IFA5_9BURK|nr:ATP-binding protein [Undibacterium fentianense]MBR7800177.1 hypothetical protein [Undibacterium fentianense]
MTDSLSSEATSHRLSRQVVLGLILFSLMALYANEHWMKRYLTIGANSTYPVSVIDDRPEGGESIAKFEQTQEGYELECQISMVYQWPFCELAFELSGNDQGINLNQYDTVKLQIQSEGPASSRSVRVFLRNFDPAYSQANSARSLKPHEVVFDPSQSAGTVEFRLNQFMVASWWTQQNPTDIAHLGPQLENVTTLSFITGGNVVAGKYKIRVKSVEFVGQWISTESFRLFVIFAWLTGIALYLIWGWRQSRIELRESDRLKRELARSNEILESRVEERTRALAASNSRLIESLQSLEGTRYELVQNEKNAALGALVSGVAHELNTPIGNALLVSSTLSDKLKELEIISETRFTRKALNDFFTDAFRGTAILQQNLERAASLISSFKQLSADQHSEQRRQFNLADVAEETLLAMLPTIKQTGHTIRIDIDKGIQMDAYPGPLSQIFMNLINNALLHAFENIEHGNMILRARLLNQTHVEIRFSDDGNGIPAAILRRVFEPFFTTKLGKGGSGLGMHLAHTVVTQIFGGKIDIESIPGEGTSIQMHLPLVAPQVSQSLLKIGVPKDVLEDYQLFLDGRDINVITEFSGPNSRRDVVELAFFIQALNTVWPDAQFEIIPVDSYANGIEQLRVASIAALATTCWLSDLEIYSTEICISDAMIDEGESLVGIYTQAHNIHALECKSLADLQNLRLVSNRDWSADWKTLEQLGIKHCLDVKTWRQMVYMVSSGEVDALLSPFTLHTSMKISLDNCELLPIPDLRIALHGSRHFASSKTIQGQAIAEHVFPELKRRKQAHSLTQALSECGFFNAQTRSWQTLNPE